MYNYDINILLLKVRCVDSELMIKNSVSHIKCTTFEKTRNYIFLPRSVDSNWTSQRSSFNMFELNAASWNSFVFYSTVMRFLCILISPIFQHVEIDLEEIVSVTLAQIGQRGKCMHRIRGSHGKNRMYESRETTVPQRMWACTCEKGW